MVAERFPDARRIRLSNLGLPSVTDMRICTGRTAMVALLGILSDGGSLQGQGTVIIGTVVDAEHDRGLPYSMASIPSLAREQLTTDGADVCGSGVENPMTTPSGVEDLLLLELYRTSPRKKNVNEREVSCTSARVLRAGRVGDRDVEVGAPIIGR